MNKPLEQLSTEQLPTKVNFADPIRITDPEPWLWDVLAKGFLPDPTLNFWVGKKTSEAVLKDFFEAVVKDSLNSGGALFGSPDQKAVFVWSWHGASLEPANKWKKRWYEVLEPEGVKRYNWLYEAGDVELDPVERKRSMLPDYLAVMPGSQGRGYGSHIFKWTFDYFDKGGYEIPFVLASTRRSAKLYCPLLGFHIHKEVFAAKGDEIPVGVFIKRNVPGQ